MAERRITGNAEAYFRAFRRCCVPGPRALENSIKHCRNRIKYGKLHINTIQTLYTIVKRREQRRVPYDERDSELPPTRPIRLSRCRKPP